MSQEYGTEGASIAWQMVGEEEQTDPASWKLYTSPINIQKGKLIHAIAHRIGYKRSNKVVFAPTTK